MNKSWSAVLGLAMAAGVVATGASVGWAAVAAEADAPITGCVAVNGGVLRVVESPQSCAAAERAITWDREGKVGPAGSAGPVGPAGRDGRDGKDGRDGATGALGPAGRDGKDGEDGAAGPTGATGPAGPQGPRGLVGPAGPAGADGVDAVTDIVRVSGNGAVVSGPTGTSVSRTFPGSGSYQVSLPRDVTGCMSVVTVPYGYGGFAQAQGRTVSVQTVYDFGSSYFNQDIDFTLGVFC